MNYWTFPKEIVGSTTMMLLLWWYLSKEEFGSHLGNTSNVTVLAIYSMYSDAAILISCSGYTLDNNQN